jgi:uncharacterized protein (DUF433 family)
LSKRIELGQYIVADPAICHGKPTFIGTRIMVWQVLDELAGGMTPDDIVSVWGGKVSPEAIEECRLSTDPLPLYLPFMLCGTVS